MDSTTFPTLSNTDVKFGAPNEASNLLYSFIDTSRLMIYLTSLFLVIYGSKRALNVDTSFLVEKDEKGSHTLDHSQAVFLPIGASIALLTMFLFFNIFQFFFMLSSIVLSVVSFAFFIQPICQEIASKIKTSKEKISIGCCGRYTFTDFSSLVISIIIVFVWIVTGHWLLMDILGMGLCVSIISFIRLPNLKVATLLLCGLLLYDVFWVFCSQYLFNDNVMVKVATRPAYNPMNFVAKKLNVGFVPSTLSLPGKLMFPSSRFPNRFGMLGLGDIVMPGLLISFVLRYEVQVMGEKRQQAYFKTCIIGYIIGLVSATLISEAFHAAQPALLYLVPSTLIPLIVSAKRKGDFNGMWDYVFIEKSSDQLIV